jgi:alpha-tubulin suppressor-like RCC1 family protein
VVAVGSNEYGQIDVGSWTDIVQVDAGELLTVRLKADGTVLVVGFVPGGQLDVSTWTNIVQVAAGAGLAVGLKPDGTVVAEGYSPSGECDVDSWTDIVQVAAGWEHTVGLKADGTVLAMGYNKYGQLNVGSWTGITQMAAGYLHTIGLKSDGTMVCVGLNDNGQCNISDWDLGTASTQVTINIRPEGDANRINLRSNGKVAVAILSTDDFDASSQVDQSSLTFGATGDEQSLISCKRKPKDVNHDGVADDLVCHFNIQLAGFQCGNTEGILKGKTKEGKFIEGKDSVNTVKCK